MRVGANCGRVEREGLVMNKGKGREDFLGGLLMDPSARFPSRLPL